MAETTIKLDTRCSNNKKKLLILKIGPKLNLLQFVLENIHNFEQQNSKYIFILTFNKSPVQKLCAEVDFYILHILEKGPSFLIISRYTVKLQCYPDNRSCNSVYLHVFMFMFMCVSRMRANSNPSQYYFFMFGSTLTFGHSQKP